MPERKTGGAETSSQMTEELLGFVDKAEFGSPEIRAGSDFINLNDLYQRLEERNKELAKEDNSPESKLLKESNIRITEFNIALLNHQISQNKATVRGYKKAYDYINDSIEAITEQTLKEPENSKGFDYDGAKIYHSMFITFEEAVTKKMLES